LNHFRKFYIHVSNNLCSVSNFNAYEIKLLCYWQSRPVQTMQESCSAPDRQVNAALIPGVVVLIARRLLPLSISVVPCLTRVANLTCQQQERNWCTRFTDNLFPISLVVFPSMFSTRRYKSIIDQQ
jgi:hypothetical protein